MVSISKAIYASIIFALGYGYAAITQHLYPVILEAITLSNTLEGIIWFGIILTWTIGFLIAPLGMWYYALTERQEIKNPVLTISIGIGWFIFAFAFTYLAYFWITPLTGTFNTDYTTQNTLLLALFWIGLITTWLANTIILPTKIILEAKGN